MGMSAAQYLSQLQALLPPGAAWPREPGLVLTAALQALAAELARVDARADDLVAESDPRTTWELLADWERAYGLPEPCVGAPDSVAERIQALVEKVTRLGGQTPAYYIAVAARLGFAISITEFDAFAAGDHAGDPVQGEDWQFAWQVNAPETTVTDFLAGHGAAGDRLRDWGNEILECVIRRLKPAHTYVIFAYGG